MRLALPGRARGVARGFRRKVAAPVGRAFEFSHRDDHDVAIDKPQSSRSRARPVPAARRRSRRDILRLMTARRPRWPMPPEKCGRRSQRKLRFFRRRAGALESAHRGALPARARRLASAAIMRFRLFYEGVTSLASLPRSDVPGCFFFGTAAGWIVELMWPGHRAASFTDLNFFRGHGRPQPEGEESSSRRGRWSQTSWRSREHEVLKTKCRRVASFSRSSPCHVNRAPSRESQLVPA